MKNAKKERVENFLNSRMESDDFTIDDLLAMTVDELSSFPELLEIGKITISTVLSEYKRKYEDDFFSEIDGDLLSEAGGVEADDEEKTEGSVFSAEEIQALKQIIQDDIEGLPDTEGDRTAGVGKKYRYRREVVTPI